MSRFIAPVSILGAVTACSSAAPSEDSGTSSSDVGSEALVDGMAEPADASRDYHDFLCTGRQVPPGLPCVAQDIAAVGPCDGHGGVAFDGQQCLVARGVECSSGGVGAFDSIEECGVSCAAAGQCPLGGHALGSAHGGGAIPSVVYRCTRRVPHDACRRTTPLALRCMGTVLPPHRQLCRTGVSRAVGDLVVVDHGAKLRGDDVLRSAGFLIFVAPSYVGTTYCGQRGS
jgi:hypothetical protein